MNEEPYILRHEYVWGNHRFYPVNEKAKQLLEFADTTSNKRKRTSLTEKHIMIAKQLGWNLEIQRENPWDRK